MSRTTDTPTTLDRLPQDRKSAGQDRFIFRSHRGVTIDVPALVRTSMKVHRAIQANPEDLDNLYNIADTATARDALEDLDPLDLQRFGKLWAKQAKNDRRMAATAGKSQA